MDYGGILRKAWQIISKHPYLWFLGLLAGGNGGFQFGYSFSTGDMGQIRQFFEKEGDGIDDHLAQVAGAASQDLSIKQIQEFLTANWIWVAVGVMAFFLLLVLLIILSISCQGGLVKAVAREGDSDFFASIKEGFRYFWPVFLIRFLIPLCLIIVVGLIFLPAIFGFIYHLPLLAFGCSFLAIIILIPLMLFGNIWMILGTREAVLAGQGFISSLKSSFNLIKGKIGPILLVFMIDLGVRIAGGLMIALSLFIALIILGGICFLVGLIYLPAGIILGSLFLIALITVFLTVAGFLSAFSSGFWTLSFQQLAKPKLNR